MTTGEAISSGWLPADLKYRPEQLISNFPFPKILPYFAVQFSLMNKASIIGAIAAITVIISAFLPWISVPVNGQVLVFTGLHSEGSSFGEPGKLSIAVSVIVLILFLIPKSWPARVNLFTSAFLAAWAFRNMLIFSRCEMGICPDQKIGLFLSLGAALVTFICVLANRGGRFSR